MAVVDTQGNIAHRDHQAQTSDVGQRRSGQTVTPTDTDAVLGEVTIQSDGTFAEDVTLPNEGINSIVASVR